MITNRRARRRQGLCRALGLALACGLAAASAQAQDFQAPDPAERARVRIGPFYLHPTVAITDVGVDRNVFNDETEPREDFTATVTPALDYGLRAGPARLSIRTVASYVWYQELTEERHVNILWRSEFELRFNRVRPFALVEFTRTRARQGDEIDIRARRSTPGYGAGVEVRVATRSWLGVDYRRVETTFDDGQIFEGVDLGRALDSVTETLGASLRVELTPLTTFVLMTQTQKFRFDRSTFRDADSYLVRPTLSFNPDALVSGSASVGFRDLRSRQPGVPDYRGLVASVDVSWTPLPSTRLGASVSRDTVFSFEDHYSFYVSSGGSVTLAQRIAGAVEAIANGRRQSLDYQGLAGAAARTDTVTSYGAGLGYRLGQFSRLQFEIRRTERRSPAPGRSYEGTQYFASVQYGF